MVSAWLSQHGLQHYQEDFKDACIDEEKLLSCNQVSLEKLNVRQKHRPLILNAIADLKTKPKKFNLVRKLPSVQYQQWNAVCEAPNVKKFNSEKDRKSSRKSDNFQLTLGEQARILNSSDEDW